MKCTVQRFFALKYDMKTHKSMYFCNTFTVNTTITSTTGNLYLDKARFSQQALSKPFKSVR